MNRINITVVTALMLMASVVFTSCEKRPVKRLINNIESVNKTCPVDANIVSLSSIDYNKDENIVELNYDVNDDFSDTQMLTKVESELKEIIILSLQNAKGRNLINDIRHAGSVVKLNLKTPLMDKGTTIELTSEDLEKVHDNQVLKDKEKALKMLELEAAIDSTMCPIAAGNGKTIVKVGFEDKTVVYTFEIADSVLAETKRNKPNLENNFKFDLRERLKSDVAVQAFAKTVVNAGAKMKCIFVEKNKGEIVVFAVTAYEFNELLPAGQRMR